MHRVVIRMYLPQSSDEAFGRAHFIKCAMADKSGASLQGSHLRGQVQLQAPIPPSSLNPAISALRGEGYDLAQAVAGEKVLHGKAR